MRTLAIVIRILLIFLVIQKESNAARCYQCNSRTDKNCDSSEIDRKYLRACPLSHQYCRKAVYIYYFTELREHFTVRECAKWGEAGKDCYRGRYKRDSYQLICECKGAGCNRSAIVSSQLVVLFSQLILLVIANSF